MSGLATCFTVFACLAVLLPGAQCLQWTGPLRADTIIPACSHSNVTLPWRFQLDQGETMQDIRWRFLAKGRPSELVGVYGDKEVLPTDAFSDRVQFVANAGLVLSHVTPADTGSYRVEVDVHDASYKFSQHHVTFHLHVSDVFQVTQEPLAAHNETTDTRHVLLKCGLFSSMKAPSGVLWQTPSGEEVDSTSYRDGYLYLQLANPVAGGKYTCRLPPNVSSPVCLPDQSALSRQAEHTVDETQARLTLLEADNTQLKRRALELTSTVEDLRHFIRETMNERNKKTETAARRVAFHASLSSSPSLSSGTTVILDQVLTNDGDAYSPTTGHFVVPYNGTYFLAVTSVDGSGYTNNVADLEVKVDDTTICKTFSSYGDYYETGMCHLVMELTSGQRVWLRTNGQTYLYGPYTRFSGFLLNTDE